MPRFVPNPKKKSRDASRDVGHASGISVRQGARTELGPRHRSAIRLVERLKIGTSLLRSPWHFA